MGVNTPPADSISRNTQSPVGRGRRRFRIHWGSDYLHENGKLYLNKRHRLIFLRRTGIFSYKVSTLSFVLTFQKFGNSGKGVVRADSFCDKKSAHFQLF